MATRPVFVPDLDPDHQQLVHEYEVDFHWLSGPSPEQAKLNIAKLHTAAGNRNLTPLLEVSLESDDPLGAKISASNLAVENERSYIVPLNAVCHARSCALYVALEKKKLLDEVVGSQNLFIETLLRGSFYQSDGST